MVMGVGVEAVWGPDFRDGFCDLGPLERSNFREGLELLESGSRSGPLRKHAITAIFCVPMRRGGIRTRIWSAWGMFCPRAGVALPSKAGDD